MQVQQVQIDSFLRAKALHLEGRFPEAEAIYLHLLEDNPADVDSLHLLGLLHADTNRVETSVQLLRVAIALDGPKAWLCKNLGVILERSGDRAAAIACYRQALVEAPEEDDLWVTLATTLTAEQRHDEAAQAWKQALDITTSGPAAQRHYRIAWANSLALSGSRLPAIEQYSFVLAEDPRNVEATFHRAVAYMQENKRDEAIDGFQQTLLIDPRHARAANNLGILAQLTREYPPAIAYYRAAIRLDPEYDAAIYNLGTAWQESYQPRKAICVFRKLLKRNPDHASAWTTLGNAWLAFNETETAMACYRRTLALSPEEAAAHWNLGIVSLLCGDLENGWKGYERRFDVSGATPRRTFTTPTWQGEPLAGKSLLLHAEQGLGDTLQFIRYAKVFAAQGARVSVECQAALLPLLTEMEGVAEWIAAPKPIPGATGAAPVDHLPTTDFQLPTLSAPAVAGTTEFSIPFADGYLRANEASIQKWSKWLGRTGRQPRVGLCWAGNPNHKNDKNRSIPAELLAELEEVSEVEWVNLQKGHALPASPEMRNAARELRDFGDTAGLIENLDLVISVDTSVAHLAGALGKPVWVLLPFAPDWRWMMDRSDSPWYSGARLFRQERVGDWVGVLRRVAQAVRELAG